MRWWWNDNKDNWQQYNGNTGEYDDNLSDKNDLIDNNDDDDDAMMTMMMVTMMMMTMTTKKKNSHKIISNNNYDTVHNTLITHLRKEKLFGQ